MVSFSVGALLGACLLAAAHGVSLRSSAVGFFDADPATVVSCAPLAKVVGRKEGTLTDGVPSGTAMPSGTRRCAWLIEAYPESEDTPADIKSEVSLFFIRVQLPAPQDDGSCKEAVKVYEGCDSDARLLHDNVFCGKTVPPMIKTNKRCLYVEFRADHDTKGLAFEANFKTRIVSPGTPWSGKLAGKRADLEAKQEQVEMRLTRAIKAANASAQHILTVMRGPAGNHGPRGVRGPAGGHGPDGPVGPRGEKTKEAAPKGTPGIKGPRGRQGMDGDEGADATGGAAGEKGATGITGMSGEGFTGEEAAVREPLQRLLSSNLAARIRSILKEKPELEEKLAEGVVNAFQDAAHKDTEHKYKNSALPLILDGLKSNPGILGKVIRTSTESDKMSAWEVIGVFKDHMKEWAANVFQPKPTEGKAGKAGKAGGTPEEIAEAAAIASGLPVGQHMIMDKMENAGKYPRGKYPLQQGRADDPVDPASCDMGAYAQCTANIGAAPLSKVDPKEMCAYQRKSYACLAESQCATSPAFVESVVSLRAFMKKLQCNALPAERSHQHIAGRHCNDGPLGYTTLDDGAPLDSAKCGCDGGEQKVELTPPAVEDDSLKTEKGDAQPAVAKKTHGVMCKPRGSQPKSTTYPVSACDEAEVEAIHKCIKNNQAGFCEACLPMFQIVEFCLNTNNEVVTLHGRATERLVSKIWHTKCMQGGHA